MHRIRGSFSFSLSLAVVAAAQLLYNPLGHAQQPGPPPPQPEPQVQMPGQPGPDPNVAPQPPYPPPGPPPVYGPIVTLRANNPRARLQVQTALKWQDVCLAPCNVPVNPAGAYRVGGGTIRPSEIFNMPRPSGPVVIDVEAGSNVKRWVGFGLILGGIGFAVGGTLTYMNAPEATGFATTDTQRDAAHVAGILYVIAGIVLLAVGIPLSTSHTTVQVR